MRQLSHRLTWIEICGFRSFGSSPVRIELDSPVVVVHAGNSQGKTGLAEAIEFLISGHSTRRELFGGAKAEYNDSLRNAHLPADHPVYVEAEVRSDQGTKYQIRRELICDFARGVECESRVFVDGEEAEDMSGAGLPITDPPVRAPVLLQHILRHAVSTEPKQRVAYFKALLSMSDLDLLRDQVSDVRKRVEQEAAGIWPGAGIGRVRERKRSSDTARRPDTIAARV
jgi:hypothetical protein